MIKVISYSYDGDCNLYTMLLELPEDQFGAILHELRALCGVFMNIDSSFGKVKFKCTISDHYNVIEYVTDYNRKVKNKTIPNKQGSSIIGIDSGITSGKTMMCSTPRKGKSVFYEQYVEYFKEREKEKNRRNEMGINQDEYEFGCASINAIDRDKISKDLSMEKPLALVEIDDDSGQTWVFPVVAKEVYDKAMLLEEAGASDIIFDKLCNLVQMCETNDRKNFKNITELRKVIREIVKAPWPNSSKSKVAKVKVLGV